MDADRWQRIDELFHLALATDPGERDAWLAGTTTDPELRAQVEALLRAHAAHVPVLDDGPELLVPLLDDGAAAEPPEGSIGPYRLVRELGRGGMGIVWLAERDDADFRQRVAVKCLRPGAASADLVERFRRERRILAGLAHPNIAQLYDGGLTDSGEPYFVMEYVEGEPLDAYCDRRRLTVEARVQLFAAACEAVQYAHQRLVVHRDLKPGNVLVSADGHVKLLDFGIAKLLDEESADGAATRLGVRPLTPDYASPEQIRGEPASTASDVYGLGVVLHELLTGRKPSWQARLVASGGAAAADTALEAPSRSVARLDGDGPAIAAARGITTAQLGRRLRGDLDTIVLTALDPDPARRYPSPQALLEDLRRWQAGRPIAARPPALSYRASKFARRNPAFVAAATLAAVLAIGYVATVLAQSRRIAAERDRAEVERARAVQVAGVLAGLFGSADPLARERRDTLRIADVLDGAAQRVRAQLAGQPLVLADILTVLSRVHFNLSRYPDARGLAEEAVRIRRAERDAGGLDLAESLNQLGLALQREGRPADAEAAYREALAIRDSLGAPARVRASSLINLGGALQDQLRFDSAASLYDRALALLRTQPTVDTASMVGLLNQRTRLAMMMGDDARAVAIAGEIVDMQRVFLGTDHPGFAFDLTNYGVILARTGRDSAAETVLREAIALAERTVGPRHQIAVEAKHNLGDVVARRGDPAQGERMLAEVVEEKRRLLGPAHPQLAVALSGHADILARLGRTADAADRYGEAVEVSRGAGDARGAGINLSRLAHTRCERGETARAFADFAESIRVLEAALPPADPFVIAAHRELGSCHARLRDWAAAEPELLEAYTRAHGQLGAGHPETARGARALVDLYDAMGQPEKAGPYRAALAASGRGGDAR